MKPPNLHRSRRVTAAWLALLLGVLISTGTARAALSAEDLAERLGVGDPALGAGKASAAGCLNCHGSGAPATTGAPVPRLDGQLAGYTLAQLERFNAGQRSHPPLGSAGAPLATADAEDIAAWFASSAPMHGGDAAAAVGAGAAVGADGARLFSQGDRSRDIIACVSCHGADGRGLITGSDSNPAIGGQSADYLRARLRVWRAGPQPGAPISVMNLITKALGDAEIDALAAYLSQLQPTP